VIGQAVVLAYKIYHSTRNLRVFIQLVLAEMLAVTPPYTATGWKKPTDHSVSS